MYSTGLHVPLKPLLLKQMDRMTLRSFAVNDDYDEIFLCNMNCFHSSMIRNWKLDFQWLSVHVHLYFLRIHPLRGSLGASPARTPRLAAGGIVSVRAQFRGQD